MSNKNKSMIFFIMCFLFILGIGFCKYNQLNKHKIDEEIIQQINYTFFLNPIKKFDEIVEFDECKSSEINGYKLYGGINNKNNITMIFEKDGYKLMAYEDKFFDTLEKVQNMYHLRLCESYKFMLDNFN